MLAELGRRLRMLIRRRQFDRDLEEEMYLHRELREQEQIEAGAPREAEHYATLQSFGNPLLLREQSRDMWGRACLEHVVQDIRYRCRTLVRNPGLTAVASSRSRWTSEPKRRFLAS